MWQHKYLNNPVQGPTLALVYVMYLSARSIGVFSEKVGSPKGVSLDVDRHV